ncbi:MAG TPA: hypothetical protein VFW51_08600 [Actinomycetota bacterium]|nr:hypothetical protein [Actinomycetota bacterium]
MGDAVDDIRSTTPEGGCCTSSTPGSWLLSRFPIGAAIRSLQRDEGEAVASDVRRELRRWPTGIPFTTDVHTAVVHGVSAARRDDRSGRGPGGSEDG